MTDWLAGDRLEPGLSLRHFRTAPFIVSSQQIHMLVGMRTNFLPS